MSADLFQLLFRGYFPKELPPAFNTYSFAKGYPLLMSVIPKEWGSKTSWPAECSIPKNGIGRRYVHVLNPLTHFMLAKFLIENISKLESVWSLSPVSYSVPVKSSITSNRFFLPKSKAVANFQDARLERGMDKLVEMTVDISNFYPSIYTHTIPWALVGKENAKLVWKKLHSDQGVKDDYNIGNQLDRLVENCQDKQTHGIPVGPDVSFVIAETILSRIDANIKATGCEFSGCRYYDDYYLYFDTEEDAQRTLKVMIDEFKSFGLEVNLSKVVINHMPVSVMEEFATRLSPFEFTKTAGLRAVRLYFEVLWALVKERPNAANTIFRYGLSVLASNLRSLDFGDSDRRIIAILLFKTAVMAPAVIPDVLEVLSGIDDALDAEVISRAAMAILKRHVSMKHHLEVLWTLWMCKKFSVILESGNIVEILGMNNPLCTLMALDYMHSVKTELLDDSEIARLIAAIEGSMSEVSLYDENWILLYEGTVKGWLKCEELVNSDSFFKKLSESNISFYDIDIDADYTDTKDSYTVAAYSAEGQAQARRSADTIMERVKDKVIDQLMEVDEEYDDDDSRYDMLESRVNHIIEEEDLYDDLFTKLLDSILSGTELDEEEIEDELVAILSKLEKY